MDWDQVVLRSLDDLRNYDVTMVCIIGAFEYNVLQLFENNINTNRCDFKTFVVLKCGIYVHKIKSELGVQLTIGPEVHGLPYAT